MHPDTPPAGRLLSNGRYTVLVTGAGGGVSTCDGYALTAWRGDRTEDGDGFFVYLRDRESGASWSAAAQPIPDPAGARTARAEPGRVVLGRRAGDLESELTVAVAEDDCELRRLVIRNHGPRTRTIEATSYVEVVLNDAAAQASHPAFAKLFVQTEHVTAPAALLAWRRPRSADAHHPWMVHAAFGGEPLGHETDRARFLGRGRTRAEPAGLAAALSGTCGRVLDPVFSLRRVVSVPPGGSAEVTWLLGLAPSRAAVLGLVTRHADTAARAAAFAAAATREAGAGLAPADAGRVHALTVAMLYGHPAVRAAGADARGHVAELAALGVPGGLVALVVIEMPAALTLLDELDRLVGFWRSRALAVSPVIVCGPEVGREAVGGRFPDAVVLARAELPADRFALLTARADLVVPGAWPALTDAWIALADAATAPADSEPRLPAPPPAGPPVTTPPLAVDDLHDWNGVGGFSADGREYVLRLAPDGEGRLRLPPMPWTNVVANERFGFLVSERGAGHTWSRNSREHRLTPWSNDPIGDSFGEALYVRDREDGACWTPQGGPLPGAEPLEVRHGFGVTRWHRMAHGLAHEVCTFVPQRPADPVKMTVVRLHNRTAVARRLSVYAYHALVLGASPEVDGRHVRTTIAPAGDVVWAVNPLAGEFGAGVVFAAVAAPPGATTRATADRGTFLGRGGSPARPAAVLAGVELDGRAGAGLDPCAALQVDVTVAAGATVECVFLLGEGDDAAGAHRLLARYREPGAAAAALADATAFWTAIADAVVVTTPDPAIDRMLNGWLAYQVTACRLWGRSAFYQSGGAFGFRDQLQDAAALIYTRPDWTRAQIVLHAGHQFQEGDVLHWWHPPADRGMRTRFADDLLWLPWIAAFYVATTGDASVLAEPAPFLTARALADGEDEAYLAPTASGEVADVYAHCCRALDRSLGVGAHGLPLMGTGDWNDGMNRVGREGRGESVWMAFFLHRVLADFEPLCARRDDHARAARYRAHRAALVDAIERAGWDGAWYRRAYYDDGTPLGSAGNQECRIDVLVQAWAVLSGAAPPARADAALAAAEDLLIAEDDGIIRLLTPAFDRDPHDPGYIKGYIPGIRENGGQYTHAALWAVQAFAESGRRERAAALLAMLSPVAHSRTAAQVAVYQVEPYVIAADVYGVAPHVGRGGWTWYTGSAGWMLRVALESVLGVRVHGGTALTVAPRIPDAWPGYTLRLRLPDGATRYEIVVQHPGGGAAAVHAVAVDGAPGRIANGAAHVDLVRDGAVHRVVVTLGT